MFEHVGVAHYIEFFTKVKELLADDGVMLLHSIGRMEPPGATNTWLRKYIFPGGYTPAMSEVLTAIEKVGLWVTDIEILRLHYAETLRDVAAALPRQPRTDRSGGLRRAFLPDVGLLPRRLRSGLPLHESNGLPDPDRPPPVTPCR